MVVGRSDKETEKLGVRREMNDTVEECMQFEVAYASYILTQGFWSWLRFPGDT
jgi:hypothetical protein